MTFVDPVEVEDQYGNPNPQLQYGPDAPRRDVRGYMQPQTSAEPVETGRQAEVTRWRLFTYAAVGSREQVEWRGRTFRVDGTPEIWAPAFGPTRFWVKLVEVEG
ncbi:hypothetical protein UK23_10495 [Lentzea aerocolonigenes]|uniref:Phage head-tail adapter protein n=1 Tax=Lentzea aerocolonigenes TaxID=68170 RepID=A0A0F0H7Y7_LENAE|nr:hypothetical protein [Lentzea aerocolonigenes]KJK50422.1 hypothetical protein UK23_10495 [Lentzea aerocolonigenes]